MSDVLTATLDCPTCHGALRTCEGNGTDSCQECRGGFLGELSD